MIFSLLACSLPTAACQPEIGDSCASSLDCSAEGDRLCDTAQQGGYCTIFACEPGSCPADEAICVAFASSLSTVAGCKTATGSPYQRTFCMASCESDGDCRPEYRCQDMSDPDNPFGAVVVEEGPVNPKVCLLPFEGAEVEGTSSEVCTGYAGEFPEPSAAGASGAPAEAPAQAGAADGGAGGAR